MRLLNFLHYCHFLEKNIVKVLENLKKAVSLHSLNE